MSASAPSSTNTNRFEELPYSPSTEDDRFQTFERRMLNNSSEARQISVSPASLEQSNENKFQMFDRWMRDKGLLESHRADRYVGTTSIELSSRDDSSLPSDSNNFINNGTIRVCSDCPPPSYPLPLKSDAPPLPFPSSSIVRPQPSAPPFTAIESSGIQDTSLSSSSSCERVDSTVSNDIVSQERFAVYNDKQQLPAVIGQGDNVVVLIGSNPSSLLSAQPPFTIVEATAVEEVNCDVTPFPVDQIDRLPPPSPPDMSRRRGLWERYLRYVSLGLVLIAIGAVAATIATMMTNNTKNKNEANRTDTPDTFATDDTQEVPNTPSTYAPAAPSSPTKCTFCKGYDINSDLIITGTVITCGEVYDLAPTLPSLSDECTYAHHVEGVCCPYDTRSSMDDSSTKYHSHLLL